jgi:hypothetical protein
MPTMPDRVDAVRALATKTAQGVASVSAALRKALARLLGGTPRGDERRTR